jgi:phage terminase small subunit
MSETEIKLTPKQEKFCEEYLVDLNATQAAIRTGYSEKTARSIASELLTKPNIQHRLRELRDEVQKKTQITKERVLEEYGKLAFANMIDYVRITPDGDAYVDLSNLTRDQAAALSEITVDDFTDGRGEDARDIKRIKIKLSDKKGALDSIAKHLGMFVEKHEVTGKDGQAIELKDVSDTDSARRIAFVLAKALKQKPQGK